MTGVGAYVWLAVVDDVPSRQLQRLRKRGGILNGHGYTTKRVGRTQALNLRVSRGNAKENESGYENRKDTGCHRLCSEVYKGFVYYLHIADYRSRTY